MFWKGKFVHWEKGCFLSCKDVSCLIQDGGHSWQTGNGSTMFGIAKYPINRWTKVGVAITVGCP
eukprot:10719907-Prorocentrum_lima.AAC.1